jgi:hypothetical protein
MILQLDMLNSVRRYRINVHVNFEWSIVYAIIYKYAYV